MRDWPIRVISCNSFTDSSSRSSSATILSRVGSESARKDLSVENMMPVYPLKHPRRKLHFATLRTPPPQILIRTLNPHALFAPEPDERKSPFKFHSSPTLRPASSPFRNKLLQKSTKFRLSGRRDGEISNTLQNHCGLGQLVTQHALQKELVFLTPGKEFADEKI